MKYVLVDWPDSQCLMEEGIIEECVATEESGSYLVPEDLYEEIFNA